jgi:DNA methylase/ParB-like nuclease domain
VAKAAQPEFTVEYLDPRDLQAHPLNFRRHGESQMVALGESIREHSWLSAPIFNRTTRHLLDGHARVELAVNTDERLIPVRVIDVSEAQEKRILASFDKIGAMAEPDDAALAALLSELAESEAGLPAGWAQDDLDTLLAELAEPSGGLLEGADPDAIPEEVETRCKTGELWRLGEHKLIVGDCTDAETVGRLMEREVPGAIVTDPPYGLEKEFANDDGSWLDVLREALALYLGGPWIYTSCAASTRLWREAWSFLQPDRIVIWHKPWNLRHPSQGLAWHFEPFLVRAGTGEPRGNISDVLTCASVWRKDDPESVDHPTQKPVELMAAFTEAACEGSIYDPFAGSGTTLIACQQTSRVARCIEIEPRYCDLILARFEACTGQSAERLG